MTSTTPANPGRQTSGGGTTSESALEDPLDRMFAPSEDSDWEETFLSVLRPSSSSTPATTSSSRSSTTTATATSSSSRGEDVDQSENKDQEQDQKQNEVDNSKISLNASNSQPIELLNENSKVVEVVDGVPSGSFKPLWSQEFISCASPTSFRCVPLYKVEGREDPEKDEGFNEPESPFKSGGPMLSGGDVTCTDGEGSQNDPNTSQEEPSKSPNHPEKFFDNCDILQWVINDSNISNPNILNTSPSSSSSEEEHRPTATTTRFISDMKRDSPTPSKGPINHSTNIQAPLPTHFTPKVAAPTTELHQSVEALNQALDKALKASSPTRSTPSLIAQMLGTEPPPIAGPTNLPQSSLPSVIFDQEIKSEPDPDWNYQPPKVTGTRKRGRPSLPSESRSITPHPSMQGATSNLSETEASAQKFRRMRDLNNEASRRCRENRKLKQELAERELEELLVINKERRRMVAEMEKQVAEMKAKILQSVSGGHQLLQQQPPPQSSSSDFSSMWSNM